MMSREITDHLLNNPYRVLGLPASAGQDDIDIAARQMRIWKDPAQIPPTPWDRAEVGPLRRDKPAVDAALTTLLHPVRRLMARAMWFAVPQRSGQGVMAMPTGLPAEVIQHDHAVEALYNLARERPDLAGNDAVWALAIVPLSAALCADGYVQWVAQVERDGRFEKGATADEIAHLADYWGAGLLPPLRGLSHDAYDQGRYIECVGWIRLAQFLTANGAEAGLMRQRMLELMERTLLIRCPQYQNQLYQLIQDIRARRFFKPRKFRATAERVDAEIRQSVLPMRDAFLKLQAPEMQNTVAAERQIGPMANNMAVAWYRLGAHHRARNWQELARQTGYPGAKWRMGVSRRARELILLAAFAMWVLNAIMQYSKTANRQAPPHNVPYFPAGKVPTAQPPTPAVKSHSIFDRSTAGPDIGPAHSPQPRHPVAPIRPPTIN